MPIILVTLPLRNFAFVLEAQQMSFVIPSA